MDFLNKSFRIGRFFGVNVRVHILFFLLIAYYVYQAAPGGGTAIKHALVFCGMLFGLILCHEFGHCFAARSVGGDAEDILMWPLGGLAYAHAPMTPWAQFVTVAGGPLVNVAVCILTAVTLMFATGSISVVSLNPFRGPGILFEEWQYWVWLMYFISYANLLFNLLPVFPMDGGQLFRTIIWPFIGLHRATIIAAKVGIGGAILFGVFGISRGDFLLVSIAMTGAMTSYQHLRSAEYGLQHEAFMSYRHGSRSQLRTRGFWSRLMGKFRREKAKPNDEPLNPNPGAWDRKMQEIEELEVEVDRILAKVHDRGMHSLSYVERQTLERATRERQKREREFNRVD